MKEECVIMSKKELYRIEVLGKLQARQVNQKEAASLLKISDRQIRRLLIKYQKDGASGLASKKRGKISNHRISVEHKNQALLLIQSKYPDFGPTLAQEYLLKEHNLKFGVETIRQMMLNSGIWKVKLRKRISLHHSPYAATID